MAIKFSRTGPTGNIFYILGRAASELRNVAGDNNAQEMFDRVKNSHSYDDALAIIREYVDLEEEA